MKIQPHMESTTFALTGLAEPQEEPPVSSLQCSTARPDTTQLAGKRRAKGGGRPSTQNLVSRTSRPHASSKVVKTNGNHFNSVEAQTKQNNFIMKSNVR